MLKDHIVILCFLLVSFVGLSQTTKREPISVINYSENVNSPFTLSELKMLKGFYKDNFEDYVIKNSNLKKALKHLIRNRIVIKKMPGWETVTKYKDLPTIRMHNDDPSLNKNGTFNKTLFNPFNYEFQFFSEVTQLFRIEQTDYFLIIKPQH